MIDHLRCVDCGALPPEDRLHPAGRYHEEPVDGGGRRPVYDGPVCAGCVSVARGWARCDS